jgi:PAS domain S-box-containing protein
METIIPIDKEVLWDKDQVLVSKTDKFGNIKYCNEVFVNVSGYEDHELVGRSHNIIRHPDMPAVIFKLLWASLKAGQDFHAVIKNLSKSGRYYWVITQFEIQTNSEGEIVNYIGRRKGVPTNVSDRFETLYTKLKQIENAVSVEAAEDYLYGYLDDKKMTYNQFLENILSEVSEDEQTLENEVPQEFIFEEPVEPVKTRKSFLSSLFK